MNVHYTKFEVFELFKLIIVDLNDCEKLTEILTDYDFISLELISKIINKISEGKENET